METVSTYFTPPLPLPEPFRADLEPAAYLLTALEYMAALDERPTPDYCREVALIEEVHTHPEDSRNALYAQKRDRLFSGASLENATDDELRRDALARFGYAKDRQANGEWALEPEVWLEAADEALRTYAVDRLPKHLIGRSNVAVTA